MLRSQGFPQTRPSMFAAMQGGEGWRDFFNRYAPAVFRVARCRGLDPHDAEDIVQQVMIAIYGSIGQYDPATRRHRFRTWVRTITDRKIVDLYRERRRKPTTTMESVPDEPQSEEPWRKEWRLLDMLECLEAISERISPRRMQIFRMYSLEGRSACDVASEMGITPGLVYVTRCQVLEMIRKHLKELESEH